MRNAFLPAGFLLAFAVVSDSGGAPVPKAEPKEPVSCVITGDATCEAGKVTKLTVKLTNNGRKAVELVGSLDASSWKRRFPHCYFEITGPDGKPVETDTARCKQMNQLRLKDFVTVQAGGTFDPFQAVDDYGFFSCHQLAPETFRTPGEYRLRFVYSTDCADLAKWQGTGTPGDDAKEVAALFERVPKLTVRSAELKLTVTAPGK